MKVATASIALLLCMISAQLSAQDMDVPGDEAKLVLVAPSTARIGELIRLDVSDSTADSFKWVLVPGCLDDFEVYDGGRKAVFSARTAGDYQFIVACAKEGTVDIVRHIVRVKGPPPSPATDDIGEWIPVWMWPHDFPVIEIELLAASFEAVAERKGVLLEPKDWIEATAAANREALGDSLDAWKPLLNQIGAALHKQATAGTLHSPDEHAQVWMEIANALRKG